MALPVELGNVDVEDVVVCMGAGEAVMRVKGPCVELLAVAK